MRFESIGRHRAAQLALSSDWKQSLSAIRRFYEIVMPEITEAGRREWGVDPYEVNWPAIFTPIEDSLWQHIRWEDIVLYPQFPANGFFLDFANPVAKVCIECDGAAFHADKLKDERRDAILRSHGWSVYRISGRDCHKQDFDSSTRKLIQSIKSSHNIGRA